MLFTLLSLVAFALISLLFLVPVLAMHLVRRDRLQRHHDHMIQTHPRSTRAVT